MAISALDHPLLAGLLGDPDIDAWFTPEAEIAAMLRFEAALARAEGACGVIPETAVTEIVGLISGFSPDMQALAQASARDGLIVPALVSQLRAAVSEPHRAYLHFGSTSQDVIDTALVLRLGPCLDILEDRLRDILAALETFSASHGAQPLMGRTRMQQAIAIRYADRLDNWITPLREVLEDLATVRASALRLQCGGAAGTLDKLGDAGPRVAAALGRELDLPVPARHWQTNRRGLIALTNWCAAVTAALGKIGQDVTLMTQNEIGELRVTSGGGSSAMPHKVNPINAEALVTLSRFVAVQSGGMQQAAVHEQERSGISWTLEWMLLPQIVAATGVAGLRAKALLGSITLP
ncbi:MAG: 3-carboxy-cis,cis-muconate cycloisomerase [Minwuia sp.]|nr:3-carboxy-cis,cis-muconate cycloisomerase [Minwuia sp.]